MPFTAGGLEYIYRLDFFTFFGHKLRKIKMVFNARMKSEYLAQCCVLLGVYREDEVAKVSKTTMLTKLNAIDKKLDQLCKTLDSALPIPPHIPVEITQPILSEKKMQIEEPMDIVDESMSGVIERVKAKYTCQVKEIPMDLALNEKKKILTQIRKAYYNWYLEYIEVTIVQNFGHYKDHRQQFIKREPPSYTVKELHELCQQLLHHMMHNITEPTIQSDEIKFLTDTRERKVRQQILRLFVTYHNYLEIFFAYDQPHQPALLDNCLKRIKEANLTGTVEQLMICGLQHYVKKFEKKFGSH